MSLPKHLPQIKQHFERELAKAEKKLVANSKTRKELEAEISTLKEGREWCESVYKVAQRGGGDK